MAARPGSVEPEPPLVPGQASAGFRDSARRGLRSGAMASLVNQLLSVAATLVLVHLLDPRAFGIVAAANSIVGLIALLTEFGLAPAIIRRPTLSPGFVASLTWASLLAGGLVSLACAALSLPLAELVGVRSAAPYLAVLALSMAPQMVTAVPRALLQRALRFSDVYLAMAVAMAAYVAIEIVLAVLGFGAWAVILGQIANSLVLLAVLCWRARWLPRLTFSFRHVREVGRFSFGVFLNSSSMYAVKNADYWTVGRFGGAGLLGIYYIAYVLPNILRQRLSWMTSEILLPVFAKIQDNEARQRTVFTEAVTLQAFLGFPAMLGVCALSRPIVHTFFGSRWIGAVWPMRILAVAAMIDFVTQPAITVLLARGRPGQAVRIQVLRLVVFVAGLVAVYHWKSLLLVAAAVLVSTTVALVDSQRRLRPLVHISVGSLLKALMPATVQSILMAAALFGALHWLHAAHGAVQMVVLVPLGAVVYVTSGLLIFRRATRAHLDELSHVVRRRPHGRHRVTRSATGAGAPGIPG